MSDSDYGSDVEQLSASEIERRRRKNKKKKESKKQNKRNRHQDEEEVENGDEESAAAETNGHSASDEPTNGHAAKENGISAATTDDGLDVEIEYVSEDPIITATDPAFNYFAKIFDTFKVKPEDAKSALTVKSAVDDAMADENGSLSTEHSTKAAISERILQDEMDQRRKEVEEAGVAEKMSRRKLRLSMQPSIAALKATTARPDVVEWADVTSRDPHLLVELKAYRNTVMVPRHWNAKRKYLAGKRGFERPPFDLPDFIKRTGIMEMRETMWEKEDAQSLKSKMRERVRPKMGRIDIDYQKLHDAFFRWQTKPAMSRMGELYYEGKEQEAQMREKKPGQLSDDLRISLGMPVGMNCHKFPPPWLIAMQRYGPPPSYPNLKIAGLNAPIPEGCAFGYHAGGWGKPPVDEYGKPLYGDVFGMLSGQTTEADDESRIERRHWGEIGSDEGSSDEESDEDGEEDEESGAPQPPESGFTTPATTEGFATPSGITTIPGVETPESIELRKRKGAESSAGSDTPAALYSVLPEKKVDRFGGQLMGSSHVYDLSRKINVASDGVEVSLNPEELDMADQHGLERKYEEQLRKQTQIRHENTEDLSDMVAEQNARLNRKRKVTEQKKSSSGGGGGGGTQSSQKKYKDFKF